MIELRALAPARMLLCLRPEFDPRLEQLRQIAWLTGEFRVQLAKHTSLTFTATISHVCRAIRKLAAVATPEEASAPLYRGVRGELSHTFWAADEQGMVCATDVRSHEISHEIKMRSHEISHEIA